MPLTLDYRPKTFIDVVGQPHVTPVLRAFVDKGKPPPVVILAGVAGTGKTSSARIYAAALNCPNVTKGNPCGTCEACVSIQEGASDAVIEIDAASHGGVAEIRSIRDMCMYAHSLEWRVIIIDEAQALSGSAFKALLKIMEEPPENTVFLLLTTEPETIPKPVKSRAASFELRSVPLVEVAKRVQKVAKAENFPISPVLSARIAQTTDGHLRDAIMELDKCIQTGITEDADYLALTKQIDVSLEIIACAVYNDLGGALAKVDYFFSATSDLKKFLDQLLTSIVSLSKAYVGVPSRSGVVELAHMVSRDSVIEAYNVLWEAYLNVKASHNPKVIAQMVATKLVATMATHEPQKVEPVVAEQPQTILSEDREISIEEAFAMLA